MLFLNPPFPPQVLEPRFNVETMALLLNIPPNKTLLRRHLATHFGLLVGTEAQQSKQECLENPDYSLLTATAKVKVGHRTADRIKVDLQAVGVEVNGHRNMVHTVIKLRQSLARSCTASLIMTQYLVSTSSLSLPPIPPPHPWLSPCLPLGCW